MHAKWHVWVSYFAILFGLWLILAEFGPWSEWIVGGLASVGVLVWLKVSLLTPQDIRPLSWRGLRYFFPFLWHWLIDLLKANIEVAAIVLSKKMNIDPKFYTLEQPLKSEVSQAILANAITLTPGTLTVDYDDESLKVHGLRPHHFDDLKAAKFLTKLKSMEAPDA